ncbi:uncharacterized protein LOC100880090 [Megachile rotundata]|uniref:uncharacterized protein LOC100880090 n=1 Tax=Megachile rotundata TaxID=143995 RepID=UPI000258EF1D|nr:PREDICTED: uncharacterized protein LOC100880090 [Megachile rotundata]
MATEAQTENVEETKENETEEALNEEQKPRIDIPEAEKTETKPRVRKYITKHMKLYPELYRSDVSIHPSYTTLKILPYNVVCRRRLQSTRKQIKRQLNREIMHFAMMQMFALDSVRIDRVFSVGMPPKTLIVPDFATDNQRRHIHELIRNT